MKKVSLKSKLSIKKEAITTLNKQDMNSALGGQINSYTPLAPHCVHANTHTNCASCHIN
jgi:hypothetical protein